MSLSGTGGGTATSTPAGIACPEDCSESYDSGQVVSLSAAPIANSTFTGWSGDVGCSEGLVTMNSDVACTANFAATSFTLTVSVVGNGTATSTPVGIACPCDCFEAFDSGQEVTLSAVPDSGSTFAGWSGDADCFDGQVTMDVDVGCTATFDTVPLTFTLTVVVTGDLGPNNSGTVTADVGTINCGNGSFDCDDDYGSGTPVILTATPSPDMYSIWGGDCEVPEAVPFFGSITSSFTMDQDRTCTASFTFSP